MRGLKIFLKWFVIILIIANVAILISGKSYMYKGLANTYLKGRKGPSIDEYKIFDNREVKSGNYQPWPKGNNYNKKPIPEKHLPVFKDMETTAFLIVKDDSLNTELYYDGFNENSITNSFSMAKTFVSVLVGIAINEGKIKSVDQPIGDFLSKYKEGENSKVTVKHLLNMSSGIDFDEDYVSPFAYPAAAYYGNDLEKLTYKYKVVKEPGKTFEYLSGNTALLAFVLEKATGKTLSDYASEKLWKPIGAKNPAFWSLDKENGHEKAYCCFNSNAPDFARIGQIFLKKGNWKGKQIVPEKYVEESIIPADLVDTDGVKNIRYGYSWWLMSYKNMKIFYARGILGQYIICIPEKNMVVVRLGKKREKRKDLDHPRDVFTYIDAALEMN